MGLAITNYPLLGGIASVDNCYANIRDIKLYKIKDAHELSFVYYVSKDGISVDNEFLLKTSAAPFTQNVWETCYNHLKETLTAKSITFTDQY